ncbi:MAG: hypothetical protein HGA33_02315 [Candidatus Moranbacteria bacterium]|nr:hypothetical protein [Candidatus Moranbacteria bacterium]
MWVHVFAIFACGMFFTYTTAWWRKDEWIPIADQGLLSLGRKTMKSSTFLLVFLLGLLLPDFTPWESVRTPAETNFVRTIPRGVVWLYLLALGGAVASVGLITSGLYDAQGAETAGNAGATKK